VRQEVGCRYCTEEKTFFSRSDALVRHVRCVHPRWRSLERRAGEELWSLCYIQRRLWVRAQAWMEILCLYWNTSIGSTYMYPFYYPKPTRAVAADSALRFCIHATGQDFSVTTEYFLSGGLYVSVTGFIGVRAGQNKPWSRLHITPRVGSTVLQHGTAGVSWVCKVFSFRIR